MNLPSDMFNNVQVVWLDVILLACTAKEELKENIRQFADQ